MAITPSPELTVVIPLVDDRGYLERAIASWTRQTIAAERFEIVAVTDSPRCRLARRARALLRPHDRLEIRPDSSEMELYEAGAKAARAELLVFTEAHCLAQPDALAALLRHLAASSAAATQMGGAPMEPNAFARFETRLLEQGQLMHPEDPWRWISLKSFAVRRPAWLAVGGLPTTCGRLGDAVFGVRLLRSGYRIDRCPEAHVHHGNCVRPRDLAAALRRHGRGQGAWRERSPPPARSCSSHSPVPAESRALRIFFNGHPAAAAPEGNYAISRSWFRRGEQLLAISCAPFHPAAVGLDDPRELGVALFSLRFEPDLNASTIR